MLTVMVVDDDPLLCTAMRRKIEMIDRENQLGIQETLIAHSAQEAWGILQEKSVDILISDIRMPYQTGLELADKVNEAFPEIQVVILSGHDDYEYMRSALRSGVVDYLLKPVKPGANSGSAAQVSGESSPPEGAISPKRQRPGGTGKLAQRLTRG